MMNKVIKIISCGGTFEKEYDPITGKLVFNHSYINKLIKRSRSTKQFTFHNIMMIDSLEMTEQHRMQIANYINISKEEKILIIHGTDTMVETSEIIAKNKRPEQTVVITGAMVPASMKNSDAFFNFGYAIGALDIVSPGGVWVAMSGSLFEFSDVVKNTEKGIFENKNS